MVFIQSLPGPLGDIEGYIQLIPGTYKKERPIETTGVDKVHLECDFLNGSNLNGSGQAILYSFAVDQPSGYKNRQRIKSNIFLKKSKKACSVSYNILFGRRRSRTSWFYWKNDKFYLSSNLNNINIEPK